MLRATAGLESQSRRPKVPEAFTSRQSITRPVVPVMRGDIDQPLTLRDHSQPSFVHKYDDVSRPRQVRVTGVKILLQ